MSQTNDSGARPSRPWVWLPFLGAATLVAIFAAGWLYFWARGAPYANAPVYWWFPFGWFLFIPVFFLVFLCVRLLFWGWWGSGWRGGWRQGWAFDPALETLRERFARGDITKDQYEAMRHDLEDSGK